MAVKNLGFKAFQVFHRSVAMRVTMANGNGNTSVRNASNSLKDKLKSPHLKKDKFVVCVEGNIGSGKTKFLEQFKDDPNVQITEEPVDKWRNAHGHNLLGYMYQDPQRWSMALQSYVQLTMLQNHLVPHVKPIKILERSIFSAKYCFVENLHDSKIMSGPDYTVLTEWFNYLIENQDCHIDLIVYLQTRPEVVYERVLKRARKEEEAIPLEYLQNLHELYEDWLIKQTKFKIPATHVLVFDANDSLQEMHQKYIEHREQILCGYS